MKSIILFLLISFSLFCPVSSVGASSPMVKRHMFSPEPDLKRSHKSPLAMKLEKEVVFSGVIISSQGKWAMIREKKRKADSEVRGLLKEGDEINGMVIKEIGNNFLILAGEGKEVRLNLYHEGKSRPAILAEAVPSPTSDDKVPAKGLLPASKSAARKTEAKQKSPFPQDSGMPSLGSEKKGSVKSSAVNPFLDAMHKEQAQGSASPPMPSPFPKEEFPPNPFLEDQPPNPFLQEMPPNPFLEQGPNAGGK